MHPIIYDVAVSLDGFIAGPLGDVSAFAHEGPVVDDYQVRMHEYAAAVMGRATYEFGYQFGLKAGQNPYPHMETLVFSQTLEIPAQSEIQVMRTTAAPDIQQLKQTAKGPIYLCGGGAFAGWLLQQGLIDRVRLKRAPTILGGGVKLFGDASPPRSLMRIATKSYDNGYLLEEFTL